MEKRSRRRTRDLVTQPASQGLSQNEIGCVRISMMAKSMNALFTGRIQKRKTNPLHHSHLACNTRPVHTDGSFSTEAAASAARPSSAFARKLTSGPNVKLSAMGQKLSYALQERVAENFTSLN